ncbi:hypothetical protein ACWEN6_04210 [Sphaerisporangium sp. NPDC004334]
MIERAVNVPHLMIERAVDVPHLMIEPAVDVPHLVALVRAGATFVNGRLVERPEGVNSTGDLEPRGFVPGHNACGRRYVRPWWPSPVRARAATAARNNDSPALLNRPIWDDLVAVG